MANKVAPTDDLNNHFTQIWPTTEKGLGQFKQAVGDRPLTIWQLPGPGEWDDEHWKAVMASKGLKDEDRFEMRDAVVKWAQKNNFPLVDLTPVLQGHSRPEVEYRVDGH